MRNKSYWWKKNVVSMCRGAGRCVVLPDGPRRAGGTARWLGVALGEVAQDGQCAEKDGDGLDEIYNSGSSQGVDCRRIRE